MEIYTFSVRHGQLGTELNGAKLSDASDHNPNRNRNLNPFCTSRLRLGLRLRLRWQKPLNLAPFGTELPSLLFGVFRVFHGPKTRKNPCRFCATFCRSSYRRRIVYYEIIFPSAREKLKC